LQLELQLMLAHTRRLPRARERFLPLELRGLHPRGLGTQPVHELHPLGKSRALCRGIGCEFGLAIGRGTAYYLVRAPQLQLELHRQAHAAFITQPAHA
jgi:hypothetical protein